jgi:hypothetical protein
MDIKSFQKYFLVITVSFLVFLFNFSTVKSQGCQDSDNGENIFVRGEIQTSEGISWQDVCLNSTQVHEGYCNSSVPQGYKTVVFPCPNGCQKGACQPLINLLSPKSGETVKEGELFTVRWESQGLDGNDEIQISMVRSDGLRGDIAKVPASSASYSWQVETDLKNWYFPPSDKEPVPPPIIFDKNYNFAFQYKILVVTLKSKVGVISDGYFNVIKRPGFDLVLDESPVSDPLGFKVLVCNKGNKDLEIEDKTIKGNVTVYIPRDPPKEERTIIKTQPLLTAQLEKGKCAESFVIPYYDFEINQKREYKIKIDLDPDDELDELIEGDSKTYYITPQPGIKITSPAEGERWGIGNRHHITIEVSGPEIWTKVEIKAADKSTGNEYPIDAIHISPPRADYWWTISRDVPPGEQYAIKLTSPDPDFKNGESSEFAIIEPMFSCTDSDNGIDYYLKGVAEGVFQALKDAAEVRNADDFCLDENTLVEYFCKDDYTSSERFKCPFGCNNGVCWKSADEKVNAVSTPTPTPTPVAKNNPPVAVSKNPPKITQQPASIKPPLVKKAPNLDNFKNQMSAISSGVSKFFEAIKKLSGK